MPNSIEYRQPTGRCDKLPSLFLVGLAALVATFALVVSSGPALAAGAATIRFSIPAQPLASGVIEFSRQANIQVLTAGSRLEGVNTRGVNGTFSVTSGIKHLLAGTGFGYHLVGNDTISLIPPPGRRVHLDGPTTAPIGTAAQGRAGRMSNSESAYTQATHTKSKATTSPPALKEVIVTGTHIRGAPSTSRVIKITQTQMIESGQTNLGEVIRSLTMNFSGGQNPGVAQGASGSSISNQNITGASSVNLRGLGPDATLTLLNGRRLSYDSFTQAVDISAIPLAAVESIEIVPDGASAIYGSDAIAGVVNVILKKDYDGIAANARFGATTQGGDQQQEYSVVGGRRWSSGGFLLAYDYEGDTAVRTTQRDYTQSMPPGDIYPAVRHDEVLLSMHQGLSDRTTLRLDGLYNKRWSGSSYPPAPGSPVRYADSPVTASYVVSPTLSVKLSPAWRLSLNITSGADRSDYDESTIFVAGGATAARTAGCYCNSLESAELDADGPVLRLPAGEARLALGAGYRKVRFSDYSFTSPTRISADRKSYYAFGELFVPLVSPSQNAPWVHRLALDGAVRYENYYGDFGGVTTPKVGLVYAPSADFELKASWGESFKTPTLLQERQQRYAFLWPAGLLGASGYPVTATALMAFGGNRNLNPERASTWSTTLTLHPVALPGLQADLSYFSIQYRDRVLQPVSNFLAAFSDPAYRQFITFSPSAAQQQALIALASGGLTNYAGVPYDPSNVIALIDDLYTNAARQSIHGVDLSSNYDFDVSDGVVRISGDANWLTSDQKDSALTQLFGLAGTVYNPPHFRGRAGLTWEGARLALSGYLNYIGRLTDDRGTTPVTDASMTTVDITALYHVTTASPLLDDLQLSLSVQNLTDVSPPYLRPTSDNIVPYDSTNYSSLGRVVSVSIGKKW